MAKSHERVQEVIDKLNIEFINSPYHKDDLDGNTNFPDRILLSVILPSRCEFPNIIHTIYSIWHCLEADGIPHEQVEIIVVDNASDDFNDPKYEKHHPGERGTTTHLLPRGAYSAGKIRVLYDPIAGNHSARNKGARIAVGKYLFFSDAHMAYKPGAFKDALEVISKTQGIVHFPIAWMGAYPPSPHGAGCAYTMKLGEEIKGTWNNRYLSLTEPFAIFGLGHCSVLVERKQFLDFGGYPDIHRSYGGGEFFTNALWWMMGSNVYVSPTSIGYHLSSGRGYVWHHDNYIENVLGMSYALSMDDWRERAYINYLRRGRIDVLKAIDDRNRVEYAKRRENVLNRVKSTFNQVLVERPWNKINDSLFGRHDNSVLIFHPTWLELLQQAPEYAKDMYRNSPLQKQLNDFIVENLWDCVYKNDSYDKNNLPTI